jgi:demethylmenaquinone methyltransferase/2-methoxy-6-polyprenyl-1,4-benzoquinol methylase
MSGVVPGAPPVKEGAAIREMFGAVASRYDLLNHLLSAGLDVRWRRRAAEALGRVEGAPLLDLCCGTGDQALALTARGGRVTAVDFCLPMLALAERKYRGRRGAPRGLAGDALGLPFADRTFAGVTVAFGIRNVADLDAGLGEILRVLLPGGEAAILEFALPRGRLLRGAYLFYFRHLLPRIGGWISGRASAYRYLPDSVVAFPQREAFRQRMLAAGFDSAGWRELAGGTVALHTGRRAR